MINTMNDPYNVRFQCCQTCSFIIKLQYASNDKNYRTKNMLGNYLFVITQLSILVCTFSQKILFCNTTFAVIYVNMLFLVCHVHDLRE